MAGSAFRTAEARARERGKLFLGIVVVAIMCTTSYFLGRLGAGSAMSRSTSGLGNDETKQQQVQCVNDRRPEHRTREFREERKIVLSQASGPVFEPCRTTYVDYTPCEDAKRSLQFPQAHYMYRERHCPRANELLRCLIPPPKGYKYPMQWPASRTEAWFVNVPFQRLIEEKGAQNWVRYSEEAGILLFPGGGTMFPNGAAAYIDEMDKYLHFGEGKIRTALDTGCGVASWGAFLLDRQVLTVSFAPRDTHEAQVQFALERGVPAIIGILATKRQPYPSNSFDLAHCSRCLIPWGDDDGLFMLEINRLLRPGGYWVLSGPPVNWQRHAAADWHNVDKDQRKVMETIEAIAVRLCWEYVARGGEAGEFAIWRKPRDGKCYSAREANATPPVCSEGDHADPDQAWYEPMKACITPLPEEEEDPSSIEKIPKWPQRLDVPSPRLSQIRRLDGGAAFTEKDFELDVAKWKKAVQYYVANLVPGLATKEFRNIMDMNAVFGSFAASLNDFPVWVMNVVLSSGPNTLPAVFDRGLIGTYHDWCEAFSTYPRTYDLIHAADMFDKHFSRCDPVDMMLEVDRILRPEGSAIIRESKATISRLAKIAKGMRWECSVIATEDESSSQQLLSCKKQNWAEAS